MSGGDGWSRRDRLEACVYRCLIRTREAELEGRRVATESIAATSIYQLAIVARDTTTIEPGNRTERIERGIKILTTWRVD